MHQSLQGGTFHIEHVRPISLGGDDHIDNLALACPSCNLSKSDRTQVVDAELAISIPLFNPRTDLWQEHFRWDGYFLIELTVVGRVTIVALDLNHERRLLIREAEEMFGFFPPANS